jgi:hypothetical protein
MIQKAFDPIRADQDLIDKTFNHVTSPQESTHKARHGSAFRRGLAIATAVVLMSGVFAIAGTAVYSTPVAAVSVDINPSIELEINVLNRVISVKACNEEGTLLLASLDLIGLPVQAAVAQIVEGAAEAGYIAEDGSSIIAIITSTDSDSLKDKLEDETEDGAQEALEDADCEAVVYHDNTGYALVSEARTYGITPGRLNLIQKLIALDPTKTVDQYLDAKASEIMKEVVTLQKEQRNADKDIEQSIKESDKAIAQSEKESKKADKDADKDTSESTVAAEPSQNGNSLSEKDLAKMERALEKAQENQSKHNKGKK